MKKYDKMVLRAIANEFDVTLVREARGKAVAIEDETNEIVTKVSVKENTGNNKQPYI